MLFQIYYFSGTGNSLHIAKRIQSGLERSELVPIIGCLNSKTYTVSAPGIGFVFPIHVFTIPVVLQRFLTSFDLSKVKYFFAVATRGGSFCHVFKDLDRYLKKQKKRLNAAFYINMPNNYLLHWEKPNPEQMKKMFGNAEKKVEEIIEVVSQSRNKLKYEHGKFYLEYMLLPLFAVIGNLTRYFGLDNKFYADDNCNSCGICESICLAERIKLVKNKPNWYGKKKCFFCFACIHYCPCHAIQFKNSKTALRSRYFHPEIPPEKIWKQKDMPA